MKNKSIFPSLKNKAILAPMSGVTDVAFRALCKKYGAGMTYTEFVSSAGISRGNRKSFNILKVDKSEKPVGIQLFGNSFEEIVLAARAIENKFDIIDINCGCPAYKVVKIGAGSELLKKPQGIGELVKLLVNNVKKPISVKIRIGIDDKTINAIEVAKIVEKSGASAITVHGRTQKQGYSGKADWEIIKKLKQSINIIVIGNGDVFTPEDFKKRLEESRVDYIMIGRGAIGNPYIFKQINDYMKTGKYKKADKKGDFSEYLKLAKKHDIQFKQIKAQAIYFTKGMQNGARFREQISCCKSLNELKNIFKTI
ncbi:MAG: tRNA dihydrouridine synthase DusB [Candidatus Pacearchaeota archaeon]|jgi:tRNA-dihydrouridine synthase B